MLELNFLLIPPSRSQVKRDKEPEILHVAFRNQK